jgi:excisionase family DNA binding protein
MSDQMVVPEIFTVKEAAVLLKVSTKSLYRLLAQKEMPSATIAGKIAIKKEDLIGYMNERLDGGRQ